MKKASLSWKQAWTEKSTFYKGDSMKSRNKNSLASGERGVVAMEFVLLFPLFFLILAGIVEFGHLFYVRHTLTNASREGARAAIVFHTGSNRISWAQQTAKDTVDKYMQDTKFTGTYTVPTPEVSGSTPGSTVKVTVNAPSSLLVLDQLIPALANLTVTAETTMKME